jgi:hypothetical protein
MLLSASETRGFVKTQKADKLAPLWDRFEKSGSIQDYLKYHKAKLARPAVMVKALKAAAKRKKVAA